MSFYSPNCGKLRFGDVIKGNYLTSLYYSAECNDEAFKQQITVAKYNIILTPCCSIQTKDQNGNIILTPLVKLRVSFYDNPYFKENMLNINNIILPEKHVSPYIWNNKISEEEKLKRKERGPAYALLENFIYDYSEEYFDTYSLTSQSKEKFSNIGYYMIDFKNAFNVIVENIKSPYNILLRSKVLELSNDARIALNHKILEFYRLDDSDSAET